jgi:hypothetical protein
MRRRTRQGTSSQTHLSQRTEGKEASQDNIDVHGVWEKVKRT